jgi:hypothetical protein
VILHSWNCRIPPNGCITRYDADFPYFEEASSCYTLLIFNYSMSSEGKSLQTDLSHSPRKWARSVYPKCFRKRSALLPLVKLITVILPFTLGAGIASAAANLTVNPSTVSLSNGSGSSTPATTTSTLTNSGTAATTFTISSTTQSGGNWLSASAPTNTIGAGGSVTITVTANTAQLIPGSYTGTVTITGTGTTAKITVNLTVNGVQVSASPNPISLGTIQPQKQPATTVTVTATGTAVLAVGVAVSQGSGWLTADAAQITASNSAVFHVTVNASSLSPGSYMGTISLQCTAAPCIEVTVPVTFTVAGTAGFRH